MQANTTSQNIFSIYEGSYQIDRIVTDLNITEAFVEMKLAKAHEYRKSKEGYWVEIQQNGIVKRYKLDYGVGLILIMAYKLMTDKNGNQFPIYCKL